MLEEIYYWMIFFIKKVKTNDQPYFNSYLLVCVLIFANVLSLLILACYILKVDIKTVIFDYKIAGVLLAIIVMISIYLLLYSRRKIIEEKFDSYSKNRRITGMIIFWVYALASLPLFFKLIDLV